MNTGAAVEKDTYFDFFLINTGAYEENYNMCIICKTQALWEGSKHFLFGKDT